MSSITEKLEAEFDKARKAFLSGEPTVQRKLDEFQYVLDAVYLAIRDLDTNQRFMTGSGPGEDHPG